MQHYAASVCSCKSCSKWLLGDSFPAKPTRATEVWTLLCNDCFHVSMYICFEVPRSGEVWRSFTELESKMFPVQRSSSVTNSVVNCFHVSVCMLWSTPEWGSVEKLVASSTKVLVTY